VVASPGPPGFQSLEEWGVVPSIGGEVVTSSDEESLRETTGFTMSFSMPCSSYGYKGYGNDEIEVHVTAVTLDVLGAGGGPFHFGGEPFVVRPCGGHIVGRVTLPSTIEQVRLSFTLTLIERPGGRRIVEQSFVATMHRELEGRLEL
ncbi:MAG TPA: hypothetical protein VFD43_11970, partial [Planctomycetota bacterium]|nr:hypothetical protein [Planctomycetota bacterium]